MGRKKLCRIKISPGAKLEFEYEYKKHCSRLRAEGCPVAWAVLPGYKQPGVGESLVLLTLHVTSLQPGEAGSARLCWMEMWNREWSLASVWLHFTIFLDPDQLVDNCLTATWPPCIFYILLNTQNVGARRNSSVSLRVLMLMLCYYCC